MRVSCEGRMSSGTCCRFTRMRYQTELRPRALEVRTLRRTDRLAAGLVDRTRNLPVGFGYEQPHQQIGLVRMALSSSVTRLLPRV